MNLQDYFLKFDTKIKLNASTRKDLGDKRRVLTEILRNTNGIPSFSDFNQGSYGMHLGVEPIKEPEEKKREYDIDVALRFSENKDDWDPLEIKKRIWDALDGHTYYGATIKKSCVTVTYRKDGEPTFHVDLVPYMYEDSDDDGSQMYLPKGKDSSEQEDIRWEKSDPKALVDYINGKIEQEEQRNQFRRTVRYLKRWKQLKFNATGHAEPASIGITLIAVEGFDYYEDDDLQALICVVRNIQGQFTYNGTAEDGTLKYKIFYSLPASLRFEPGVNLFEKMTDNQMNDFKNRIDTLLEDLLEVQEEADVVAQCKKLRKIFGDDFEIPDVADVSKTQEYSYIPSTSSSGYIV